jgi:hypothetical protein
VNAVVRRIEPSAQVSPADVRAETEPMDRSICAFNPRRTPGRALFLPIGRTSTFRSLFPSGDDHYVRGGNSTRLQTACGWAFVHKLKIW